MREAILFALFGLSFALLPPLRGTARMSAARAAFALVAVLGGTILALLLARCWVQVPPGMVGTVYDPFAGGIQSRDLGEGWRLIPPWAGLRLWNARTQAYTMSSQRDDSTIAGDDAMDCQSAEGLQVLVDATILFRIAPGNAHRLWKFVGPGFVNTIVRPSAREAVRTVVSQYPIMQIYSNAPTGALRGRRKEVEERIFAALAPRFAAKGIDLERVLLRNVAYVSAEYEKSIIDKAVAQQQVLTQRYLLEIEGVRAQQKAVRAEGQAESIRLRGLALRAHPGVIAHEFVRQLPADMDVRALPGPGGVLLSLPSPGVEEAPRP